MKKIFFILLLFLFPLITNAANFYVDQGALESGVSWNGIDGGVYTSTANGFPGAGFGYNTVNAALTAQTAGDDIYLRGGTYQENYSADDAFHIDAGNSGTSTDWSSIQSYPGEWAILDANNASETCLGMSTNQVSCPGGASCLSYYKIERLEIMNATDWGISWAGGPITIRYNYIHDNIATDGGDNPAGIYAIRPTDTTIEYNLVEDNGAVISDTNNANIQSYSDQGITGRLYPDSFFLTDGLLSESGRYRNNIRYNRVIDNHGYARWGIKHKSGQTIMPHAVDGTINESRKNYGDKIHHNLVTGGTEGIITEQDVVQIYNNIVPTGEISVGYRGDFVPVFSTIYNNYAKRLFYSINTYPGIIYYLWEPSTSTMFRKDWSFNNIIDSHTDVETYRAVTMGYYLNNSDDAPSPDYDDSTVLDLDEFYFKNNYIYRPDNNYDVWNADLVSAGHRQIGQISAWESAYSPNISGNYRKTSSEATDSLFLGTSGYQQYVMNGNHTIAGATTIANGGIGGNHPYLDGVTIPNYVGPANPSSYSWIEEVNNFSVAYFTAKSGQADSTYDEAWIEGDSIASDTTPPANPTQLTIN